MRLIFINFFMLFSFYAFADQKQDLPEIALPKTTKSFTVLSRISPWSLDKAVKAELTKKLSLLGHVVLMDSDKAFSENLGFAMKDATFLTLSIDAAVEESVASSPLTYKIVICLSLRVLSGVKELEGQSIPPTLLWEQQASFDFNSNGKLLIEKADQEVQALIQKFSQNYLKLNEKNQLVFYLF